MRDRQGCIFRFEVSGAFGRCIAAVMLGGAILVEPSGSVANIACRKNEHDEY